MVTMQPPDGRTRPDVGEPGQPRTGIGLVDMASQIHGRMLAQAHVVRGPDSQVLIGSTLAPAKE